MKLIKKNEQVNRIYNEDGTYTDVVVSISYEIKNDEGNVVGSATCNQSSINMSQYNFTSIDASKAYLEGLFSEVAE